MSSPPQGYATLGEPSGGGDGMGEMPAPEDIEPSALEYVPVHTLYFSLTRCTKVFRLLPDILGGLPSVQTEPGARPREVCSGGREFRRASFLAAT